MKLHDVLYSLKHELQMHDVVALLEDLPTKHFETGQSLKLRRGQIGTVVMTYDDDSVEVEFSGQDGRAFAIVPVKTRNLMVLQSEPELSLLDREGNG